MATVTVSRRLDAPPDRVRELVADVEPFMAAGGFDEVAVDGDAVQLTNRLGFATMELVLDRVDDDAALSFEQREGMFEAMTTTYEVEPAGDDSGSEPADEGPEDEPADEGPEDEPAGDGPENDAGATRITATTEFELGASVVGDLLDATVVRRQRTRELESQFDYLESELGD